MILLTGRTRAVAKQIDRGIDGAHCQAPLQSRFVCDDDSLLASFQAMKNPRPEKLDNPFSSSSHYASNAKPLDAKPLDAKPPNAKSLVTRDGLNAAARKTSAVIVWVHLAMHSAALLLFALAVGAMWGAFAGSWLLQSGRVPASLLVLVSRWSWAVGGALGLMFAIWLVRRWFDGHKRASSISQTRSAQTRSAQTPPLFIKTREIIEREREELL